MTKLLRNRHVLLGMFMKIMNLQMKPIYKDGSEQ